MLFFFNDTATTEIYTLALHDALPISEPAPAPRPHRRGRRTWVDGPPARAVAPARCQGARRHPRRCGAGGYGSRDRDRKSTRLNSSHANISYAVFCLKKKKKYSSPSTI